MIYSNSLPQNDLGLAKITLGLPLSLGLDHYVRLFVYYNIVQVTVLQSHEKTSYLEKSMIYYITSDKIYSINRQMHNHKNEFLTYIMYKIHHHTC